MNATENGQICRSAYSAITHGTERLSNVPGLIKKIIANEAWLELEYGPNRIAKHGSLLELITTKPMKGWGEDPKKIEALIKDDAEALAMWRDAITQKPGKRAKKEETETIAVTGDNRTNKSERGTTRSYTVSRLKRERPDLFDKVANGDLSANAAAIEAGFRKPPPSMGERAVSAFKRCEERLDVLKAIVDSLKPHELEVLKEWVDEPADL